MTYRGKTVGAVVPAYDEEGFVGDVIERIPAFVDRVYAVDDCSTDGTWRELTVAAERVNARREATDGFDRVVVPLQHDRNRGAGGAALTGYRHALEDGLDVVASLDGDGQMDPRFLPALLDPVVEGTAAYAKGNRLASPTYVDEMSRWRLFGNLLLTGLTKAASGYWRLWDPQNGYTVASREALQLLDLDDLHERYGFRNDVLVQLSAAGCRVADVSHPASYGEETSDIQYSSFVPRLSWLLFRRFWWRLGVDSHRFGERLVAASYIGGVLGFLLGAVEGLGTHRTADPSSSHAVDRLPDGGTERPSRPRPGVVAALAGLLLCCLAVALDWQVGGGEVVAVEGGTRPSEE